MLGHSAISEFPISDVPTAIVVETTDTETCDWILNERGLLWILGARGTDWVLPDRGTDWVLPKKCTS